MNLEFELLINWKHRNSNFYKKIGSDTLITCKPKMVSIVSISCKFGATEVARQGSLNKTLVFNFYVGIYY